MHSFSVSVMESQPFPKRVGKKLFFLQLTRGGRSFLNLISALYGMNSRWTGPFNFEFFFSGWNSKHQEGDKEAAWSPRYGAQNPLAVKHSQETRINL